MLPGSRRKWFFLPWQEKWRESLWFVFSPRVSLNTNRAESVLDRSDGHSLLLPVSKVEAPIKRFSFGSRVKRWMKARALISPFTLWKAEPWNMSRLRSENKDLPPLSGSFLAWPSSCHPVLCRGRALLPPRPLQLGHPAWDTPASGPALWQLLVSRKRPTAKFLQELFRENS